FLPIAAFAAFSLNGLAAQPPAGFVALFNEKDLSGWRGGDTMDHRWLMGLPEEERAKTLESWTADMKSHWKVENGELLNDGHCKYCTTGKAYGDSQLLLRGTTRPL